MPEIDYYKTLGVSREASDDEIRKAYKKLAREYHPDTRPNDKDAAENFKRVQEAYSVLNDSEKRELYDRYGSAFQGAGRSPYAQTQRWPSGQGGSGPVDFKDIFGGEFNISDLFGGAGFGQPGPTASSPRKGGNLKLEVEIPFLVAAEGGNHVLQLNRSGKTERLNVKIPEGVDRGSVIRLSGQGHPGTHGGPNGDLLLTVKLAAHPTFRREGKNLLLDVPITPAEAVLGAKVEVPTLTEGNVAVTVPPGTSSGTKLRLRGKGVIDQKTKQRGDQFVAIKIVVPQKPDDKTRSLYEQLAQAASDSPRTGLW
jgi:DnaJ-class molecular chaperone